MPPPSWKSSHRRSDVLQPVLAQVARSDAPSTGSRSAVESEHLAAVPRAHDARREMHVGADVALVGQRRLAGVQAHAHAHRPAVERPLPASAAASASEARAKA